MPNPLAPPEPMVRNSSDFDPPLKRIEPTVPGYWTIDEIAAELGMTGRKVRYDVTGRPELNLEPSLKAYKIGQSLLVPDADALDYIFKHRIRKKS